MNEYVIIPDIRIKEINCKFCNFKLRYIRDEANYIKCPCCLRINYIEEITIQG